MLININKINKLNLTNDNIILFYGDNSGLKNEVIEKIINDIKPGKIIKYQENEILLKPEIFYDQIFTKSLFEETKIIIVNQVTDKILKLVNEIDEKKIDEVFLILNADYLEKKSKLRIHFEKKKKYFVCSSLS